MKLVQKLTLAFLGGMTVILTANGMLRIHREVSLFESDQIRDDKLLGRSLAAAAAAAWRTEGLASAIAIIRQANDPFAGKLRVRWTWLDQPNAPLPSDSRADPRLIVGRSPFSYIAPDARGQRTRYTYVQIPLGGQRPAALELAEPQQTEEAYIRRTVTETITTAAVLAAVCAALASFLGAWLVGSPIEALVGKARRVGAGDFETPVCLSSGDELAILAGEMNLMSERLGEAVHQLRHADRLTTVGKLASGVAHELGTPLNVISARAEMIFAGDAVGTEAVHSASVIMESCDRVTTIVRQLLEFARRSGPEKAARDLRELAQHSLELLSPLAAKAGVKLVLEPGPGLIAHVDAGQIQQVLTNIVMNGVQAMPNPGTVAVAVAMETVADPTKHGPKSPHASIRIRDEGSGMTRELMLRIFEPFYTTKGVGEGTGLGLAVAYGIVRDHGGFITVKSEPGRGSEFAVHLPEGAPS